MRLIYRPWETNVGQDVYACVQYFREEYSGQEQMPLVRQSAPYVLYREMGSRTVVPGSACESLTNLKQQLDGLTEYLRVQVAHLNESAGEELEQAYCDYDRHLTNSLVLISCLARNLFVTFPRLSEEFKLQVFDYEGNEDGEIRVKDLLDLFVHHRYMNLHNEFITDLVSDRALERTAAATETMGHKFRFLDFITRIREAVESVTVKDLATRLLAGVKSLHLDTPFRDVVFLVQNTRSFSDIIEATIPTRAYDFMRDILFPVSGIPKAALKAADGDDLEEVIHFRNPHIELGQRLDEKKIRISAKGTFEYRSGGRVVLRKTESRVKEIEHEGFFLAVIQSIGQEGLLDLTRRIDQLPRYATRH